MLKANIRENWSSRNHGIQLLFSILVPGSKAKMKTLEWFSNDENRIADPETRSRRTSECRTWSIKKWNWNQSPENFDDCWRGSCFSPPYRLNWIDIANDNFSLEGGWHGSVGGLCRYYLWDALLHQGRCLWGKATTVLCPWMDGYTWRKGTGSELLCLLLSKMKLHDVPRREMKQCNVWGKKSCEIV
jgi:hypothetical protein